MKTSELMLGDWVYHQKYQTHPAQVKCIYTETIETHCVFPNGKKLKRKFKIEDCIPIPLTTKILADNGFLKNDYYQWYMPVEYLGQSEVEIFLDETHQDNIFHWSAHDGLMKEILYVHELQHILRILGSTLEISL